MPVQGRKQDFGRGGGGGGDLGKFYVLKHGNTCNHIHATSLPLFMKLRGVGGGGGGHPQDPPPLDRPLLSGVSLRV